MCECGCVGVIVYVCVCVCVRAYVHASVRVYINLFVSSQRFHTCRSVKLRHFTTIVPTRYIHRHRECCTVLRTHHK